jgi:ABC transport system ATP-binding/permease protein
MWKLTIEDDPANKWVVHLVREEYGLGRSEDNAVRLTERNISRRHAQFEKQGEHWLVKDLSSYNGTYVNGQRVAGNHELIHGDLIQLGDYRLALEDEAVASATTDIAATVPVPRIAPAGPAVDRLIMLVGPTPGTELPLGVARMTIGRGDDCDIPLNHASVSRLHAELHPVGDGRYEIIDKGSANGVRVNGMEMPRGFIDARDVVELGDVILKFIPAGESYIPAADESLQIAAIGAARRREAEEGLVGGLRGSLGLKIGLGAGLALIAGLLLVGVITRRGSTSELVSVKDEVTDRSEKALADAKKLLAHGDTQGAYAKAATIPVAADPADKRSLYDQIARSPAIDGARRSRAAEQLALLSSQAVNVTDLPNTPMGASSGAPIERRPATATATASPEVAVVETPPPTEAPAAMPAPRPAAPRNHQNAATKPPAAPATKSNSTTLVRESPF